MTNGSDRDTAGHLPDCPHCGQPAATVTIRGPMDRIVNPCGCRVDPVTIANPRRE